MASKLDFSPMTWGPEQVRDVKELVIESVLQSPDLNYYFTMFSGIVTGKEIGFLGEGGPVGMKSEGCHPKVQDWKVNVRKLVWNPQKWIVFLDECASDLENSMAVYSLKSGTAMDDLTDTDYMAVLTELLSTAVKKAIFRMVFFGDIDAVPISKGGIITEGLDKDLFNIIDGIWKQVFESGVSNPTQLISIKANAEATKALQYSELLPQDAHDTLSKMHLGAPILLRQSANARFLCTQSFADAYMMYLEGKGIESTYKNLVDGINVLYFRGIELAPVPMWDEMIQAFHDEGATFHKPHRCILVEKENMAMGTPSGAALEELDIWYDKKEEVTYMKAKDKIDVLLLDDKRVMMAY